MAKCCCSGRNLLYQTNRTFCRRCEHAACRAAVGPMTTSWWLFSQPRPRCHQRFPSRSRDRSSPLAQPVRADPTLVACLCLHAHTTVTLSFQRCSSQPTHCLVTQETKSNAIKLTNIKMAYAETKKKVQPTNENKKTKPKAKPTISHCQREPILGSLWHFLTVSALQGS